MNVKKITLAAVAALSFPLAACNDTAEQTAAEEQALSQAEREAAYDQQTADNILNCTSQAKVEERRMEPNYKGTFSEERKAWHQEKISRCVNLAAGNLYIYSYDPEMGVRETVANNIHNAEISAWENGTEAEYPTQNQITTMLANARKR